jgi:hypothetical protein
MPDLNARVVRRFLRALVLTPALLVPLVSAPAFAVPPESWPQAKPVTALDFLLVLLIIPLGAALVIALLASVPAMVSGQKTAPGQAWRNENEWFGGPKDGVDAADKVEQQPKGDDRGGASGRW